MYSTSETTISAFGNTVLVGLFDQPEDVTVEMLDEVRIDDGIDRRLLILLITAGGGCTCPPVPLSQMTVFPPS